MSSMSRDEKLVMEMQIPFTGEVFHCYSVATLMNIEYQWTKSFINQWRSLMILSVNILSVKISLISAEISGGVARTR